MFGRFLHGFQTKILPRLRQYGCKIIQMYVFSLFFIVYTFIVYMYRERRKQYILSRIFCHLLPWLRVIYNLTYFTQVNVAISGLLTFRL